MSPAVLLAFAIVAEVTGTVALRLSDGFSKAGWGLVVVLAYGLAFFFMSKALRDLELGFVYAVWAGAGTALIALVGIVAWGEPATALKLASLALIVGGVVGLNLAGGAH